LPTLQWMIESPKIHLVGVVTQPDKPVGRSQILTAPAPKRLAESIGVTVLQPIRVRRPEALNQIAELRPDDVIILPWNISDEVVRSMSFIRGWGGRFVVAVPNLKIL